MTLRAPTWLHSLVPFVGHCDASDVPLRTLRLALVLIALLTPPFWFVYQVTNPQGYDPFWARALMVGFALAGVVASYAVPAVRDHPKHVFAAAVGGVLLWFGVLAARNDLAADYAIGYCFVLTSIALTATLVWNRPGPLAAIMGVGFAVGSVVALSADVSPGAASPIIFVMVMVAAVAVFFVMFYGRLRGVEALEASQARLVEAERLAQTGAWYRDTETGQRGWSQGVYDIFGLASGAGPPPPVADSVHPADAERCRLEMEQILSGSGEYRLRFRIVRPSGETRWVDGTTTVTVSASGRCIRGVIQDVTERVRHEAEVRHARDQAEAANRAKSVFLANMSHEIRTPLTAIIGYAQVLQEEVTGEHLELVAPIEVGGRRLLCTLNSVLDLARLEAGPSELALRPVDPAAEAAEVILLLQPLARHKGLELRLAPPPAPLSAHADPDALGRVLTNLISNAIKFTDAGHVSVSVRERDGCAELAVADTGRGMDGAFLQSLYTPFHQASTGWARSHEGTGLGLTITRRLVAAMNGTIQVESQLGAGTTFTVALPLAQPASGETASARLSAPARASV